MPEPEDIVNDYITKEAKKALDAEVEKIKEEISIGKIKELNKRSVVDRLNRVIQSTINDIVDDLSEKSRSSSHLGMIKVSDTFYPVSALSSLSALPTTPSLVLPVVAAAVALSPEAIATIGGLIATGLGGLVVTKYWDDIEKFFKTEKEEPLKAWEEFPYISDEEKKVLIETNVTPEMFVAAERDVISQAKGEKKVLEELAEDLRKMSLSLSYAPSLSEVTDLISRKEANERYRSEYDRRFKKLHDHKKGKYPWLTEYYIKDLITSVFGPPTI